MKEWEQEVENAVWSAPPAWEGQFSLGFTMAGSIILGNQHVAIEKPQMRSKADNKEVRLQKYKEFQDPSLFEQNVFSEGLK